ncbi:MAG: hypothetical protein FD136_1567, partial [Chitinophagaceae bacterium]
MQQINFRSLLIVIVLFLNSTILTAQTANADSVRLSLKQAEQLFLDSNFVLLAANYNIDAQKALVEQAKLLDNPILVTDQNIYSNNRFFEHAKDASTGNPQGQYFIQVQQLIRTAGKRSKLVNMASTNAAISELQFKDVLRTLRFQLRSDYYLLMQQLSNLKLLLEQQSQLDKLLLAMEQQLTIGNISQKDLLRLRAVVISLDQDITDLQKQIADTQADLKMLLRVTSNSFIVPVDQFKNPDSVNTNLDQLITIGKQNNPYYQIQQSQLIYQQQNLLYQKALKAPDLTIGPEYDHNSNYIPHYVGVSISLPLTLFNKNQGNIKSAQFNVKQQEAVGMQTAVELDNQIANAYNKWLLTIKQQMGTQHDFYEKYNLLFHKMTESYKQRQVGLLEYLDFFNNYQDAKIRLTKQQLNVQMAAAELNFFTGKDII